MRPAPGGRTKSGRRWSRFRRTTADKAAEAIVNRDPFLHSNLRTTCVATMLDGGHARNALAQRAGAYVNCRIFPGHSVDEIRSELAKVIADPGVSVTAIPPLRPSPPAPPLDPEGDGTRPRSWSAKYFPGVPVVPSMANGYTDATFLGRGRHPDLRRAGRLGRSRRQWRTWPERADRSPLALCRPGLPFRPDQGVRELALGAARAAWTTPRRPRNGTLRLAAFGTVRGHGRPPMRMTLRLLARRYRCAPSLDRSGMRPGYAALR